MDQIDEINRVNIDVLEKTKSAFKSKELGILRRNLEEVVKGLR